MSNVEECVVPSVPRRLNRLPGGQNKPPSPLMFITHGRCSVLGALFARSARLAGAAGSCVFRFGAERLDLVALRHSRSMMSYVSVPRAEFVEYRHASELRVCVASAALGRIAHVCQSPLYNDYSLTLMHECTGTRDEVLHLMLCARSSSVVAPLIVRATLSPARDQSDAGAAIELVEAATAVIERHYQFRVRVGAGSLRDNVRCLLDALEPSTVTILLGPDALEMAALTRDAQTQMCVSWPFGGADCVLEKLVAGAVPWSRFRDSQRFAASTIADALLCCGEEEERVMLFLGVGESGEAMPLLVEVGGMRIWVAPRPVGD
jgi:hypothetical protein